MSEAHLTQPPQGHPTDMDRIEELGRRIGDLKKDIDELRTEIAKVGEASKPRASWKDFISVAIVLAGGLIGYGLLQGQMLAVKDQIIDMKLRDRETSDRITKVEERQAAAGRFEGVMEANMSNLSKKLDEVIALQRSQSHP